MPIVNTRGTTFQYLEYGPSSAPALMLLHGFPFDHRMWDAQVQALQKSYRVITPDFRGFGQSPIGGPFSLNDLADDVHALYQHLHTGPMVLAGLSMGGYVALAYTQKYPGTLAGLILLDTRSDADSPQAKEGRNQMIQAALQQGAKPVADAMLGRLVPGAGTPGASAEAWVATLRKIMESQSGQGIAHMLAALRDRPDYTPVLPAIQAPTLVICGEKDVITPPEVMKSLHSEIPDAKYVEVPGAGHMTPMQTPGQVNQAIAEFLGNSAETK